MRRYHHIGLRESSDRICETGIPAATDTISAA